MHEEFQLAGILHAWSTPSWSTPRRIQENTAVITDRYAHSRGRPGVAQDLVGALASRRQHRIRALLIPSVRWPTNGSMSRGADKTTKRLETFIAKMTQWPRSWAGCPEDIQAGEALLEHLEAFIRDLHSRGLTDRTIRGHLDNAWVIGGEIIRRFGYYPEERKTPGRDLLYEAVRHDEALLVSGASEREQASADATARKIHAFLKKTSA